MKWKLYEKDNNTLIHNLHIYDPIPPHIVIQTKFCYISGSPKPLMGNQVKHSLFILISFLLLSSPVIGNNHTLPVSGGKGETLYGWETSSGKVWKYFGDNKIHIKYVGEVENGVPNGLGILYYPDGTDTYLGDYGRRGGVGTYIFSDGRKYVGSWKDGEMWNGTTYDKDVNIIGKWVNGEWIRQ